MRYNLLVGGLLASIALVPALAQSNPPASSQPPAATATPTPAVTKTQGNLWRASKLKGLNVYNEQNEKLGDITEILIDKSGKADGIVIGVGGFLGMRPFGAQSGNRRRKRLTCSSGLDMGDRS